MASRDEISRAYSSKPDPDKKGNCHYECPCYWLEKGPPGWPLSERCGAWKESEDGKEPYYLAGSKCKPKIRLDGEAKRNGTNGY